MLSALTFHIPLINDILNLLLGSVNENEKERLARAAPFLEST